MARDASGTYTRVSNSFTEPTAQTTISSSHAEAFFDELQTEMTDSLSRSGKGGMSATAALKIADGTSAAPALSFNNDTDTGFIRTTANTMVAIASGVAVITMQASVASFPSVAITGGAISGITDLAVADGGTGASTAASARSNLGLGTIATQDASNVNITGGTISGVTVSGSTSPVGSGVTLIDGRLDAAVSGNALIVSVKTNAGADPSASAPVFVYVRDATATTGTHTKLSFTAAHSLTISSGSTLGTTSAVPFRLHFVVFNDGGTARLGAVNCRLSNGIRALRPHVLESSTAEGGAGAADTAGTIYTGTAVTTKAFAYAGYMDWNSGLTTAGTWDDTPDVNQPYIPGLAMPGDVIQTRGMTTQSGTANATTSYTVTNVSIALTPSSACNAVVVQAHGSGRISATSIFCYTTLARGGTPIGVPAAINGDSEMTAGMSMGPIIDWPGSSSSVTYAVYVKSSTTTQVTFNAASDSGAQIMATEVQG